LAALPQASNQVCALFHGEHEELEALLCFLRDAFQTNDKVLIICAKERRADLIRHLGGHDIQLDAIGFGGQLEIRAWQESNAGQETGARGVECGRTAMLDTVRQAVMSDESRGCCASRVWYGMEYSRGHATDAGGGEFYDTEFCNGRAASLASGMNCMIVRAFDVTRLSGTALMRVLRAHPMILKDGTVQPNSIYVPSTGTVPELFFPQVFETIAGRVSRCIESTRNTVPELGHCLQSLIALSKQSVTWRHDDPSLIIGRVARSLANIVDAEFVYIAAPRNDHYGLRLAFARSDVWSRPELAIRIKAALDGGLLFDQPAHFDSPADAGVVHIAGACVAHIACTPMANSDELLVFGSLRPDFPTEAQLLTLYAGISQTSASVEKWRAETEEHRLAALVENSSDFIGMASLEGACLYINPAGMRLVGLDNMEQVRSSAVYDFAMPEELPRIRDEYWPCLMRTGRWSGEVRFRHYTTGAAIPFWVEWFLIDDRHTGQPSIMATVSRDLTEQRQSEERLRILNENLEQQVEVRTRALIDTNLELQKQVAERERADARSRELQSELFHAVRFSAMGEMTAALAHELNQPLGAVMNYVNAARRQIAGGASGNLDQVRNNLDDAAAQVSRTSWIIRRLRDFVTRGETERRAENVITMLEEAISLALAGPAGFGVEVSVRAAADLPMVFVDKIQFQQVILNLLRNAIEAIAASERREIVLTANSESGSIVEVVVTDSGPGLAENVASRLFEPFVTSKRHGMGLGLSICRTIVESHGGRLWHAPRPGGGTRFGFTMPANAENEDTDG
jgi:PAS domain S-box-containing protein